MQNHKISRYGKLFDMVLLNMYGERIGTEVRHIRRKIKKIKSCVCHDREFKSYFKMWGKSA